MKKLKNIWLFEYKEHWNNDTLLGSPVKNIMSLYQYEIIYEFIHPENIYSKEKDKILESMHEIMNKSKKFFNPEADLKASPSSPFKSEGRYFGFCILSASKNIKVGTLISNEGWELGVKKINQRGSIGFSGDAAGNGLTGDAFYLFPFNPGTSNINYSTSPIKKHDYSVFK